MDRELLDNEVIVLGVVRADTKGGFVGRDDQEIGLRPLPGLADD